MSKLRLGRPNPAMVIAIVALIAALAGTAVAGGVLTTKKFKNQAVRGPIRYATTTVTVPTSPTAVTDVLATCPKGTKPIGGGVKIAPDTASAFIEDTYLTASGYAATVFNDSGSSKTVTTIASCVTVKSTSGTPPAS